MTGEKSLLKQLTARINGLSLVSKHSSFETRLMVANGIYNSKLNNLIQVWGGTQEYLLKALQISQNRAGRLVTGMSWFTPCRVLLSKCGWLSVKQLVAYHTILTVHNTVIKETPEYIYGKMCSSSNSYNTRQVVKFDEKFEGKTERTKASFCYRGSILYNRLPMEIRATISIKSFKTKTKYWIKNNIPVE